MKIQHVLHYLALTLAVPTGLQAATVLTIDGLEVRSNAANGNAFGGGDATTADLAATVPATGVLTSSSTVTWSNLDLDGVGGSDDTITFNLNAVSGLNNITWGGLDGEQMVTSPWVSQSPSRLVA